MSEIRIFVPNYFENERSYIIDVLFKFWLGVDYQIEVKEQDFVEIKIKSAKIIGSILEVYRRLRCRY